MVSTGTVDDVDLIPKELENISGLQLEEILNLSDAIMEQVSKLDTSTLAILRDVKDTPKLVKQFLYTNESNKQE